MSVASDIRLIEARMAALDGPAEIASTASTTASEGGAFASAVRVQLSPAHFESFTRASEAPRHAPADLDATVLREASAWGVDPRLVRAIVMAESGGNPRAVSSVGAAGAMQLMPETARALGVVDRFDLAQNIRGGTRYLRSLLDRFHGDVPRAVAAYNAGPGAVERFGGIPPYRETQQYVARVMAAAQG